MARYHGYLSGGQGVTVHCMGEGGGGVGIGLQMSDFTFTDRRSCEYVYRLWPITYGCPSALFLFACYICCVTLRSKRAERQILGATPLTMFVQSDLIYAKGSVLLESFI